jgi:hypothetical protein
MSRARYGAGGIAALLLWAAACGGSVGDAPGGDDQAGSLHATQGLPCAVGDVIARRCATCHQDPPLYGAPMPLTSWDELHAPSYSDPSRKVYELVSERIHDDKHPMPKPPNPRLSAGDAKVLDDWITAGAPRASDGCAAAEGEATVGPLDCTPDVHVKPKAPWTMPQTKDDEYVCYGFDITNEQKRHVTAIAPAIQNKKILHHLVLFQSKESVDPVPHACSAASSSSWRMVFGWAPGGDNLKLPPAAGFPLEGTTHYVAQLHYNNLNHLPGELDSSGVDMCSTDKLRANDADVMAFGSNEFTIPAKSRHDITCSLEVPTLVPDLTLFAVLPHMHKLGTSLVNTLYPQTGGPPVDLGTMTQWDFNNQAWFPIHATITPGDHIATRCVWTNPSEEPVSFGENTADEMCYAFTMYYPRVTASFWSWIVPAAVSQCSPTPQ